MGQKMSDLLRFFCACAASQRFLIRPESVNHRQVHGTEGAIMSELINRDGHVINADGSLKGDPAGWNAAAWKASIDQARTEHETQTGQKVDDSRTAYAAVQQGDWQWKIALKYGADPAQTAYRNNEQFQNPDLIHAGDVVMLQDPAKAKGATGAGPTNGVPDEGARPIPDNVLNPIKDAAAKGDQATVDRLVKDYLNGAKDTAERDQRFVALQQSESTWGGAEAKKVVDQAVRSYVEQAVDYSDEALARSGLDGAFEIGLRNSAESIIAGYLRSLPADQRMDEANRLFNHGWQNPDYVQARINAASQQVLPPN
jgi:hypothetical protein